MDIARGAPRHLLEVVGVGQQQAGGGEIAAFGDRRRAVLRDQARDEILVQQELAAATACLAGAPIVLSKAQVEEFLPGKELSFRRRADNAVTTWTFRADGWVFLRIPGVFGDSGHWHVDEEGRFCVAFQGVVPSACYHLARVDSGCGFTAGNNTVPFVSVR